jgi:hypothetical protein
MTGHGLHFYLHDDWDAFRLEVAGSLSGEGVQRVYQAWRTALSIIRTRTVIVDITFITEADNRGRALLRLWYQHGAKIIAKSPDSRAIAGPFVREALPAAPPKQGWFERLRVLLLGRTAAISTRAENRLVFSARRQLRNVESNGVVNHGGLDCRVP